MTPKVDFGFYTNVHTCACVPPHHTCAHIKPYTYTMHMYTCVHTNIWPLGIVNNLVLLSFYCELDTKQSPGKKDSHWKNCVAQIGLWLCLWEVVLIDACCGKAQKTVNVTIPSQMGLRCVRKPAEHDPKSEAAVFSHDLYFRLLLWIPALRLLSAGLWPGRTSWYHRIIMILS